MMNASYQQCFQNYSVFDFFYGTIKKTWISFENEFFLVGGIQQVLLIPLEGEGTIYSNGFFVQSILADRYIHRRQLRLVS